LIEPGPVVFITTSKDGKFNVMSASYHMVVQDEAPPLIAFMIGPWDYSYKAFLETGECTIAVPTVDMASKIMEIGN
jgi:flavin reductase (DIM6/NTAB) family NADH-FMN oxidoreductase RutF